MPELDRALGESHLRRRIAELVQHYHYKRNHQGLDNALIAIEWDQDRHGEVVRRERLGSLLSFYQPVGSAPTTIELRRTRGGRTVSPC